MLLLWPGCSEKKIVIVAALERKSGDTWSSKGISLELQGDSSAGKGILTHQKVRQYLKLRCSEGWPHFRM